MAARRKRKQSDASQRRAQAPARGQDMRAQASQSQRQQYDQAGRAQARGQAQRAQASRSQASRTQSSRVSARQRESQQRASQQQRATRKRSMSLQDHEIPQVTNQQRGGQRTSRNTAQAQATRGGRSASQNRAQAPVAGRGRYPNVNDGRYNTQSRGKQQQADSRASRAAQQRAQQRGQQRAQQQDPRIQRDQRAQQRDPYARNSRGQQRAQQRDPYGRDPRAAQRQQEPELTSTSVEELRRADRQAEGQKKARRTVRRRIALAVVAIVAVVGIVVGGIVLYNSPAFTIKDVKVNGVEHLTGDEVSQLVNVPADTTLLRVDADEISSRLKQSAWVQDVQINRVFPDTLEVNVTERAVAAIVEIPTNSTKSVKKWIISKDNIWLMPIPDVDSEGAKTTSANVYEAEQNALHIVDVPFGTKAEIGKQCTDGVVNNAMEIINGMTTELSDQVVKISAPSTAETTLVLENGVEVAFGKAEDIRDKERVVLEILQQNPDNVSYINVRMVETPTWRAI